MFYMGSLPTDCSCNNFKPIVMIRIIHIINTIAVITTLVYYWFESIHGLMMQALLGGLQILLALITSAKYESDNHLELKKLLKRYWTLVLIAFLNIALLLCIGSYGSRIYGITTICIIPMLIACYFVYVTGHINYKVNKSIL